LNALQERKNQQKSNIFAQTTDMIGVFGIDRNEIKQGKFIGNGSFGDVYEVIPYLFISSFHFLFNLIL